MTYVGGLRERYINDSVYHLVKDSLFELGWFNSGRKYKPITIRTEPVGTREEVPWNTIIVTPTHTTDNDAELGSNFGEVKTVYYVDFYAENDALGKELIHDVRDLLKGRMPSIDRFFSVLHVYDWSMVTPPYIFYCDIEDVMVDKAKDFPKPWQEHWWACRFTVIDSYSGNDEDDLDGGSPFGGQDDFFDGGSP